MAAFRATAVTVAAVVLAGCAAGGPAASVPTASATPSSKAAASPSSSPSQVPTPSSAELRLVIQDYVRNQVRLARLDATDTATVSGSFAGTVAGQAIVVSGRDLLAISAGGTKKLGHLAGDSTSLGSPWVAVNPSLSQWVYTIADTNLTSHVHLGSAAGDSEIASVPSPDGGTFYRPFAWNVSGVYMVKQGTGLGGAGPFLEYHFPLATLNVTTGQIALVAPECIAEQVLADGTMLCRGRNPSGSLEVRSRSSASRTIQLSTGTAGTNGVFVRLAMSPDGRRIVAGRNGASDPVISYQMAVADLTSATASAFGPIDYLPDIWLPDGRVVADHQCVDSAWGGGPCDQSQDGTYLISADGMSRALFFKMTQGAIVAAYV